MGWFKTVVGIGQGTQVNVEQTGWFSTGSDPGTRVLSSDPRTGTVFVQDPMTDEQIAAVNANLLAHGLDPAKLTLNAKQAYADGLARMQTDPAIVALGLSPEQASNWYLYEHDSAIAYADHGQSDFVCAAEVAATTSKAQWSMTTGAGSVYGGGITVYPNLTAAASVAAFGIENPTITLTQQDCDAINIVTTSYYDPGVKADGTPASPLTAIDPTLFAGVSQPDQLQPLVPGDYQADQLSDQQLGKYIDMSGNALLPGVPIGLPDGLSRGLAIARGADPDDILNGTKQLSFTTNIAFPDQDTTTTNDTHIGAEMLAGATYPTGPNAGQPMSDPDLAKYVQTFYNGASGTGYTYITNTIMAAAASEDPPVMGHQYQAVMWVGDPSIDAASTKMYTVEKSSKLDVQFPYRPYTPDVEDRLDKPVALQAPVTELAKKCVVRGDTYKTPPFAKDQRHARKPKWLKDRIAAGAFKGFGDPGSTQTQGPDGRFTAGSGDTSTLEDRAIAHFGAADELQGQQFVTPNGTILNLEGDSHDRIKEVMGGDVNTAESRAINAGFLRTSLDTVSGGDLGLVMEYSVPLTDEQKSTVMQGIQDAGGIGYVAIDVPSDGVHSATDADSPHNLAFSDDANNPTERDVSVMITAANAAATHVTKGFGDPNSTQEREPDGEFGPGSGDDREHAPRLRDITIGSAADTGELAMRSEPITAPHKTDPLAAQYAADLQFSTQSRGTQEGDSLTEGFPTPEEGAALADIMAAQRAATPSWFKGFGDPGSTQQQDAQGRFTAGTTEAGTAGNSIIAASVGSTGLHTSEALSRSNNATRAQISGLPPGRISKFDMAWQAAPTDSSKQNLADQQAAADQFHSDVTPDLQSRMAEVMDYDTNDDARAYVDAQYQVTQQYLADNNITEVTLYRGVTWNSTTDPDNPLATPLSFGRPSGPIAVTSNPLTSWTYNAQNAEGFANGMTSHGVDSGAVVQATIPAANILAVPATGMASAYWQEVVVITPPGGYNVSHVASGADYGLATGLMGPGKSASVSAPLLNLDEPPYNEAWLRTGTPAAQKRFGDPGSTQTQDASGRFTVGTGAPRDAANLKYPELHASDLTAGATNSPLMTRPEFQASAARGEDIVMSAQANGSPPVDVVNDANVQAVVAASKQTWGGVTIDSHGGGIVSARGGDPLSVSTGGSSSVTIPITSDPDTLTAAMQQAQTQFADQLSSQGAALGMFRDEDAGTVDFDPVLVVQGVSTARDVGAYTGAIGGAYRFSDGNGYWPGHVA